MIVLGIDPGFGTMGYGVVEKTNRGLRPIDYGVITTASNEELATRLAMVYTQLVKIIEKHKPDAIAIEELFFSKNVKTAMQVAEARGVIKLAAVQYSGQIFEYKPNIVKQATTGNGQADKKQMQQMVRAILGLNEIPKPDDAADALAIAITHAVIVR